MKCGAIDVDPTTKGRYECWNEEPCWRPDHHRQTCCDVTADKIRREVDAARMEEGERWRRERNELLDENRRLRAELDHLKGNCSCVNTKNGIRFIRCEYGLSESTFTDGETRTAMADYRDEMCECGHTYYHHECPEWCVASHNRDGNPEPCGKDGCPCTGFQLIE